MQKEIGITIDFWLTRSYNDIIAPQRLSARTGGKFVKVVSLADNMKVLMQICSA